MPRISHISPDFIGTSNSLFSVEVNSGIELLRLLMDQKSQQAAWREIAAGAALSTANMAAKRIKNYLVKGGKFNVGATGAASENIYVEQNASSSGAKGKVMIESAQVVEGARTVANYYIRHGWSPARNKVKRPVPLSDIRMWVANKGITLSKPVTETNSLGNVIGMKWVPISKYIRQRSRKGNWYARALKKLGNSNDQALKGIQNKLSYFGSKGTHLNELYPQGRGKFDYVAYFMKGDSSIRNFVNRVMTDYAEIYIDYLSTGRSFRGLRTIMTDVGDEE